VTNRGRTEIDMGLAPLFYSIASILLLVEG